LELGAFRYLLKPVETDVFEQVVDKAYQLHKMARLKRQLLAQLGLENMQVGDLAGLEAALRRALQTLKIVYQPIVCWSRREVFAYEALVRSSEASLPSPGALLSAAERLGRLDDVGRAIRTHVGQAMLDGPIHTMFVNLHTRDLLDERLYDT